MPARVMEYLMQLEEFAAVVLDVSHIKVSLHQMKIVNYLFYQNILVTIIIAL